MGPLLLGVILLLLGWLLPWPAPIGTIVLVIGIVLVIYGLYLLFVAGSSGSGRRWI